MCWSVDDKLASYRLIARAFVSIKVVSSDWWFASKVYASIPGELFSIYPLFCKFLFSYRNTCDSSQLSILGTHCLQGKNLYFFSQGKDRVY
jgi:hypothetical protein